MKELINISGQQFYYSTIDQVIEQCSQKENCSVIIDESYLDEFLIKENNKIIGECVNQLVIISEDVDRALTKLEGVKVLLIAVGNFEEGLQIAISGAALSKEVICVPKEDEKVASEIIGVIMG